MARTILEIRDEMLLQKNAESNLDGLTSTSVTAKWRLLFYIVAVAIWSVETLYDVLVLQINEIIGTLKPHSLRWYATKAKQFQYGYDLVAESDVYNNTGIAEDVIAASKIVSYAAVVELQRGLRIKVAHDNGTDLEPLTTDQLDAFIFYMEYVKDAGVKLNITSSVADALKVSVFIKFNPLVLNASGERIDGTNATPVANAINYFLKNLPFNGVFSVQKMIDAIQAVDGVEDLRLDLCSARYGALPFANVNVQYVPDSGYLRIAGGDLVTQYESI